MRASPIVLYTAGGLKSGDLSGDLIFGTNGPAGQLGQPLKLEQIYGFSIQAVYAGSPAGTLTVESSNDGVNWCPIPGTPYVVTEAGSFMWNVPSGNYQFARLNWSAGDGSSGTLTALAYVRGF